MGFGDMSVSISIYWFNFSELLHETGGLGTSFWSLGAKD